jgi:hypothetical protein
MSAPSPKAADSNSVDSISVIVRMKFVTSMLRFLCLITFVHSNRHGRPDKVQKHSICEPPSSDQLSNTYVASYLLAVMESFLQLLLNYVFTSSFTDKFYAVKLSLNILLC